MSHEKNIVYGVINKRGELVLMPREEAIRLAALHQALQTVGTWGDFKSRLPPDAYKDILERIGEDDRGFETYCENWKGENPDPQISTALEDYLDLPLGERLPTQKETFDASDIPGFSDGDWPVYPPQGMFRWLPKEIQEQYGVVESSMVSGPVLSFRLQDQTAIVQAMERLGYRCQRDDLLATAASGYR